MASNKKRTPPSLSDDLIFYEIFARLPVKSIHRFRCVSTSCRRLTSDQQFHSAVRRLHGRRYHLSFSFKPPLELALYSVDQSGASTSAGEIPLKPLIHANTVNGLMFTVNGLLSNVTDTHGHVSTVQGPCIATVSNADTNETFQLPTVPVLYAKSYRMRFYLCHDSDESYKVLHTAVPVPSDNSPVKTKCSVLTLGEKMTSWRGFDLLRLKQSGDSKSVCVNGTLYLTRFRDLDNNINNNAVIGAFIVKTERFYAVNYPAGLSSSRYYHCHLIEVKGALAVIDLCMDTCNPEIKLWVNKEKGMGVDSWTELRIDIDPRWAMTFRLSKSCSFSTNYDREIVIGVLAGSFSKDGCWIFTYNVDKGEWTTRVGIQGVGADHSIADGFRVEENVRNILSLTQTLNPSKRKG